MAIRKQRGSYRRGASFGALSFLVGAVLSVGTGIVMARLYGIDVIGEYALVFAPLSAMWVLSTSREQIALVRRIGALEPRDPRVTGLFVATFTFSSALTLVMAALVLFVSYFIYRGPIGDPALFAPAAALMLGYVLFANPSWNIDTVLSNFRAGPELFLARLLEQIAYLVAGVIGAVVSGSVWGLTIATVASFVLALAAKVAMLPGYIKMRVPMRQLRAGFVELPSMIWFGLKTVPGALSDGLTNQIGVWILGSSSGVAAVGAYSRAWQLALRVRESNHRLVEVLFPTLVERRELGDLTGFDRALVDSMRYGCALMFALAAVFGGASVGVMQLYGPGFEEAALALALLLLVPPLYLIASALTLVLEAHDRPLKGSVVSVVGALVAVPASFVLIAWIGITGAALAIVLAFTISVAWLSVIVREHLSSRLFHLWRPRQLLAQALAFAGGLGTARLLDMLLAQPFGLIAGTIAGFCVYSLLFVGAGGFVPRDRERLSVALSGFLDTRAGRRVTAMASGLAVSWRRYAIFAVGMGVALIGGAVAAISPMLAIGAVLGCAFGALLIWDLLTGLMAFVVFNFLSALPLASGQELTLVKAAGVILAITWLATLTTRSGRDESARLFADHALAVWALAAFLLWSGLSALWAIDVSATISDLQTFVLNAVLFVIVYSAVRSVGDARKVITALAIGGVLAIVIGAVLFAGIRSDGRFGGTVGEANTFALVLLPGAIVGAALAMSTPSRRFRTAMWGAAALCSVGIVLTLSRGGLLSFAAAIIALVIFGGRWRPKLLAVTGTIVAFGVVALFTLAPAAARGRLGSSGSDRGSGRVDIWEVGLRSFTDDPLRGAGLGNFRQISATNLIEPGRIERSDLIIDNPTIAHNIYLGTAVELGVFGLAALLLFLGAGVVSSAMAARRFSAVGNAGGEIVARALFATLIGYLVAAFFLSLLFEKELWVLLALAFSLLSLARAESPTPVRAKRGERYLRSADVPVGLGASGRRIT